MKIRIFVLKAKGYRNIANGETQLTNKNQNKMKKEENKRGLVDNPVPSLDIKNKCISQIKQAVSELNKEGIKCYFDEKSLIIENGVETNKERPICGPKYCTNKCNKYGCQANPENH